MVEELDVGAHLSSFSSTSILLFLILNQDISLIEVESKSDSGFLFDAVVDAAVVLIFFSSLYPVSTSRVSHFCCYYIYSRVHLYM